LYFVWITLPDGVGVLPLLATAPFITFFGLDAFGIRLTSAVLTLATLLIFYITLRRLKIPFASVAVALLGFTPIIIHVGRVNFGHAPSMFLLVLGYMTAYWGGKELLMRRRLRLLRVTSRRCNQDCGK